MVSILTPCGFHVDTTWLSHEHHMVSRWIPHDMDTMWCPGNHMVSMWTQHGYHMNTTLFPGGYHSFHVDTMWFPCGHHVVFRWTPCGFQVDTTWFQMWTPHGFQVDTTWFPQDTTWFAHGHHVVSRKPHGNQHKKTALHEANWLPCYYLWKHTCHNLVMGFMNFSLKYNTGTKNIVMTIL